MARRADDEKETEASLRDYAKVAPQFWIGRTGKALRKAGPEAQIVALYLMTNPHANMLGLYYLPMISIVHETGLTEKGASKGLARAIEGGFCSYDAASEVVWVHEMARFQIGEQLQPTDKRCAGVQNEYDTLPGNPFLPLFFDRYMSAFNMKRKRESASPIKAPSKPHRSQEQEQEQEQEKESFAPSDESLNASPVVESIFLVDGSEFPVTQAMVGEFDRLYPAVDVPQTLREMRAWSMANPKKRKTKAGAMRFINSWLASEQNKG